MLTKRSQVFIIAIFQQATIFRIIPFTWNAKERILVPLYGRRAVPSFLMLLLIWTNAIYLLGSLYYIRKMKAVSASSKAMHVLLAVAALLSAIFGYNNIKRRKEIANFMNKFLIFQNQLEAEFTHKGHVFKANVCELMLRIFVFLPYPQSFGATVLFIKNSMEPRYFYHVIADFLPSTFKYVYAVAEFSIYIIYWHVVLLNIVLMFSFWFGSSYWLKEMKCRKQEETSGKVLGDTHAQLRWSATSLRIYGGMTLISKYFREATNNVIMPWTNYFIVLIPATCNFVLIRAHDHLTLMSMGAVLSLSLSCCANCVFGFPAAASLFSRSNAYLQAFKQPHIAPSLEPEQKKRIKAFRPLKVHIGNLSFIRAFTVLKLINSIIYWTMRSLLIFKK